MIPRKRFSGHHKSNSNGAHASLYLVCAMSLFWTMSEGIVSFIAPLKIEEAGFSDTMMGVILGTSSIAGALFDLVAVRLFKDTYYKRIFAAMFFLCLIFPLVLAQATTPLFFVLAMAIWGVYYDLRNIGNYDFVARTSADENSSGHFGLIQSFQSVGWILGPIISGFLIGETVGWKSFAAIYVFLGIALVCFLGLAALKGKETDSSEERSARECRRGVWSEVRMLGKVGRILFPALLLIFFLNFTDAFFWTIGPLFAEHLGLGIWAGLLLTAWSLPGLLLGWIVGTKIRAKGKEHIAIRAQFIAACCLIPIAFAGHALAVIFLVFVAACFSSIAWPAIQGAFADYIKERRDLDKEIEGLVDLYTNLGYVFGPILAGICADTLGYGGTFTALGIFGATTALILYFSVHKRISMKRDGPPLICDI